MMTRLLRMFFVFAVAVSLAGCDGGRQEPDIKGIKIGDLAPTGKNSQAKILSATSINVISYELPAGDIRSLDEIWLMLDSSSLRYSNPGGFSANRLRAATGRVGVFNTITGILESSKARKLYTSSLLIPNGQAELLRISRLGRKTKISYIGRQGTLEETEAGPGTLGLQVIARQIPGTIPMANVQVMPVIWCSTEGLSPVLAERVRESDVRFYSAGFSTIMKPGDFLLVAPSEHNPDPVTAAGRFFVRDGQKPTVRVLLFVCVSVL